MYKVTATITHAESDGFTRLHGLYMPKKRLADTNKIKQQCSDYIRENMKIVSGDNDEDEIRQQMKITIHVTKLQDDFMVVEDK